MRLGSLEAAFTAIELSDRGGRAQPPERNRDRHLLMTEARYNPRYMHYARFTEAV